MNGRAVVRKTSKRYCNVTCNEVCTAHGCVKHARLKLRQNTCSYLRTLQGTF